MNLLSANEILLCWESKNDASFIKLIQKLYSDTAGVSSKTFVNVRAEAETVDSGYGR